LAGLDPAEGVLVVASANHVTTGFAKPDSRGLVPAICRIRRGRTLSFEAADARNNSGHDGS
jgi:hypothetical protein